jgi:glucose/arabinose dehydrogenase
MRTSSFALLLVAACGGGNGDDGFKDAPGPRDTGGATADAPPLIACTPKNGTTISLRSLGDLNDAALLATSPPNDGRLFVIEQQGRIRIFENEQLKTEPFLDISDDIAAGGERGLLGLAFHPNYANNRQFFVFYTTTTANVVARYFVSETDANKAEGAGEVILSIPDFAGNHNGGMIEFGSDNYLYIGTGDGGDGGDPCRNGQQLLRNGDMCPNKAGVAREPLLGKILRIDVDTTTGSKKYGIPADNPYADGTLGEPEIFIRGLRNPWRWSFDRMTGDMYIGDVGQEKYEELTVLMPAQQAGANLGWSIYEADQQYQSGTPDPTGITMPQFIRTQPGVGPSDGWESIIGGQVYRGTCFPDIVGDHFFTDYSKHQLMRGRFVAGTYTASALPGTWPTSPASIHADARGELFLTTVGGAVYQIEAGP